MLSHDEWAGRVHAAYPTAPRVTAGTRDTRGPQGVTRWYEAVVHLRGGEPPREPNPVAYASGEDPDAILRYLAAEVVRVERVLRAYEAAA